MRALAPWPKDPLYAVGYMVFIVVLGIMGLGLRRFCLGVSVVLAGTMILLLGIFGDWVVHTVEHALGGL